MVVGACMHGHVSLTWVHVYTWNIFDIFHGSCMHGGWLHVHGVFWHDSCPCGVLKHVYGGVLHEHVFYVHGILGHGISVFYLYSWFVLWSCMFFLHVHVYCGINASWFILDSVHSNFN